jgi:RNA polymerase sigma factor (sigma-70 family)
MELRPLIVKQAIKLASLFRTDPQDLSQIGIAKIIETFSLFDPFRGIQPSTFFFVVAKKEMLTAVFRHGMIYIPAVHNGYCQELADHARSVSSIVMSNGEDDLGGFQAGSEPTDPHQPPDEQAALNEQIDMVHEAIARLPKKQRLVVLGRLAGRTFEEIAKEFNCGRSRKVTRQRMQQIHRQMKAKLRGMISPELG